MNTSEEQQSGAGFQKDHREKIELVRACDEERLRTQTEESVEGVYKRDLKSTGLRAGEETDRAMWRRKRISHTGDPT